MDAVNGMDLLKQQIAEKKIGSLYLFYGSEAYLIDTYHARLKKSLLAPEDELMNLDELDKPSARTIMDCAETFPLMVDRRLVIVQDSGLFMLKGKSEGEEDAPQESADVQELASFFENVPETTVLVFIETNVDKRSRTYKALEKNGLVVEFKTLDQDDLAKWIAIEARRRGLRIDKLTASYLIGAVGTDMSVLQTEMNKLFSYKEGTGLIQREDIDKVITPSLEADIFKLLNAIGSHKAKDAFRIYRNMVITGESEHMIFAMTRRQIDLLYKTAVYQREGYRADQIAEQMKLRSFMVTRNLQQASRFSFPKLKEAMEETLRFDVGIKSGTITPGRAMELLIARYGSRMAEK